MPYVSEGNVKDMIKRSGKLPLEKSLFIISTLAEILNSMLKVSAPPHLSINPSNIIFNDSSSVILAGYGLKEWKFKYCLKNDTIEDWARYDGPEIKNNEKGDHRSDIYALGVLLCEMLSGQLNKGMIFIPDTALLSCKAIPANVIEIIRSATHQSRELRIQSYDELIERIKNTKKAVPKTKPPTPAIRKNNLKLNHLSRKIIIKKNN
jgi:serine/threonine protein kinase